MTQNITWWFFFTDPMFSAAPGTKSTEHCPPIWKHLPALGSVTQNQCIGLKGWKTRSFCVDISTISRQQVKFICFSSTFRRQVQSSPPSSRWPGRARRTFCRRWCSRLRSPRKHVSFRRWCSSSKGWKNHQFGVSFISMDFLPYSWGGVGHFYTIKLLEFK